MIIPLCQANWAPFLFPCTHPILAWHAPAARWQLTIARLPLIKCWNDTPPHKQRTVLQAPETLQSAIVWVKFASTYNSKQVESAVWVIGGMKGGGLCLACKFQSSTKYPSGALVDSQNQFGEGGLASTFLLFLVLSFAAFHTSLFALYHCLPVFLLQCYHTPSIWPSVFFAHRLCILFLSLCLSSRCNKWVYLFGGW